ncbi:MAG: N-acetyltransferase family protein [Phycisphaerales bacterium]
MTSIRSAEARDFDAVAALTNHYIVHTSIHFGTDPVSADELRGVWERSRARYPFLIAEVGGVFAGYAKAGVWRDRAAYSWTPETGIYIEPRVQARGVGTALYRALLDELRTRGFRSVVAGITLPNEASVRLHERVGFRAVGVVKDAGWKFGAWHDVGFWQIMLSDSAAVPAALP